MQPVASIQLSTKLSAGHGGALSAAAGGGRRRPQANTDRGVAARSRTTQPVRQRTACGGRAPLAPTPAGTRARRAGQRWVVGCARWAWTHRPRRQAGGSGLAGAAAVTGPLAQRRQRPRRRITPNTNTSTTTMISTHNHVSMAASLVGAGAGRGDATAAHPSKQLGHGQATSGPGSTAALRAGSRGPLHPATCPPIWAGRAGESSRIWWCSW
jgi:hypothetical protein